jgi:hypothetical protein
MECPRQVPHSGQSSLAVVGAVLKQRCMAVVLACLGWVVLRVGGFRLWVSAG